MGTSSFLKILGIAFFGIVWGIQSQARDNSDSGFVGETTTTEYREFAYFDSNLIQNLKRQGLRKLGDLSSGNLAMHEIVQVVFKIIIPKSLDGWALDKVQRGTDRDTLRELGVQVTNESLEGKSEFELSLSYGKYSDYRSGEKQRRNIAVKLVEQVDAEASNIYCNEGSTFKKYEIHRIENNKQSPKPIGAVESCGESAYITELCTGEYQSSCLLEIDEDGQGFEVWLD